MITMLVLSLLALAFGGSLWAAWRMRWERDRARDALLGLVALLPNFDSVRSRWEWMRPGDLTDDEIRRRLACADAALRGDPPPIIPPCE